MNALKDTDLQIGFGRIGFVLLRKNIFERRALMGIKCVAVEGFCVHSRLPGLFYRNVRS